MKVVNKFGADALRLYLINSPVVRAENLRFKEEGVRDVLKDVFLPWYNAYRFLIQNIERIIIEDGVMFTFHEDSENSTNIMDQWILSFTQSLLAFIRREMAAYRLYTVMPRLVQFIDNLTNWYVRMNRRRLKGEGGVSDCRQALGTLCTVLFTMVRFMAPFTPFLTELMYQNLRLLTTRNERSVHHVMIPQPRQALIDEGIERSVSRMQSVIELGRVIRDRKTIPIKYPLPEVVAIMNSEADVSAVISLQQYIMEELNVRKVTVTSDKLKYGVSLRAEPDHKTLGARLKGEFKQVMLAIKSLTDKQLQKFQKEGTIEVLGHKLEPSDLRIMFSFTGPAAEELAQKYEAHSDNDVLVLLDVTPDEEMQAEGIAREIINRVQKLRKKAHLVPSDSIVVHHNITPPDSELAKIAMKYTEYIENAIKAKFVDNNVPGKIIIEEVQQLKGAKLKLVVVEGSGAVSTGVSDIKSNAVTSNVSNKNLPFCRYVKVQLQGISPSHGVTGNTGYVLLENPVGDNVLDLKHLYHEVKVLFGLQGKNNISLVNNRGLKITEEDLGKLHQQVLYVVDSRKPATATKGQASGPPTARFLNVVCGSKKGTVFLENPLGDVLLTEEDPEVKTRVCSLFKLNSPPALSPVEDGIVRTI